MQDVISIIHDVFCKQAKYCKYQKDNCYEFCQVYILIEKIKGASNQPIISPPHTTNSVIFTGLLPKNCKGEKNDKTGI